MRWNLVREIKTLFTDLVARLVLFQFNYLNYKQTGTNIEARSRKRCCRGKAICFTCTECVFLALVIQHAQRLRRIILFSVSYLALSYF